MGRSNFIPGGDAAFNVWQTNLVGLVQASSTSWGIAPADLTALLAWQSTWNTAFAKASNKQNRTSADVQAKDDARKGYEKALRNFIAQWLARNGKVSDADRERMGITVRVTRHTAVAAPTSSPVGTVDFSTRGQHTIHFVDEGAGNSKSKPKGVYGCEVWIKMGDTPDFSYKGLCTGTPYVAKYTDADTAQMASYRLRWVSTKGEQGPWSAIISALVMG
jgi:hypothetical protein